MNCTGPIIALKKNWQSSIKGEWSLRPIYPLLNSYSNQECMTLMEGQTHNSMEQIEDTEIDPHKYVQVILPMCKSKSM